MAYQTTKLDDFLAQGPRGVDANFLQVVKLLPTLNKNGPWLAGGSIRKFVTGMQNKADYDVFFANEDQRDDFIAALELQGATLEHSNIFNHTYDVGGYIIQCIHHEYRSTLIQTMNRFDMTICQFGFDGTNLVWEDQASEDVAGMTFHFLDTTDPIYNLNRAFKYAREGFKPADGEVRKVLRRVAKLPETVNRSRGSPSDTTKPSITVNDGLNTIVNAMNGPMVGASFQSIGVLP